MIWLLIGYMFLYIHRPFELWPVLASVRLELVYMLVTGTLWAVLARKHWLSHSLHLAYLAFLGVVLICWLASPWMGQAVDKVDRFVKSFAMYLLIVTLIHDAATLRRVVLAMLGITAVYMLHSLWEFHHGRFVFRMGIPRLIGVDSTLSDPNSFGAGVVYSLPFLLPFARRDASWMLKLFLVGYVLLALVCIGLTGSRSSLVGLAVFVLLLIWYSAYRWRLLVLTLVIAPVFFLLLPSALQKRFETIIDPSAGPANAQASARSRLEGLLIGLELFSRYPLTGCGPGVWRKASGSPLEPHNLYGQVLGELGLPGALALGLLVGLYAVHVRRLRRLYADVPQRRHHFLHQMTLALWMVLILLLFMGNFSHNLFRHTWIWSGALLVVTSHCARQQLAAAGVAGWRPTANRRSWPPYPLASRLNRAVLPA
ncbi:MAG: O-antigen ligase family protein [Gemmataceae bacterium]|nr:O-antigen ligase family protein [Gemmataceae bacterium]MDW8266969.1 O-antigen ligase family protein [Gemmataceae bacterium]